MPEENFRDFLSKHMESMLYPDFYIISMDFDKRQNVIVVNLYFPQCFSRSQVIFLFDITSYALSNQYLR